MEVSKKNFVWNMIGTTISSFNSLFFLIIVTRINGIYNAGIFGFGFSFACLFYIIGVYSGRVFQVTDTDKDNDSFSYVNNHLISCFLMLVLTLIYSFIRGYSFYKSAIVFLLVLFKALEAFSETLYAVIQLQNNLFKVGISLFFKAIIGLIFFAFVDLYTQNLILSILSLVIVNSLIIVLYDFKNTKLKIKEYRFNFKKVRKLFIIGFWPFLFTFLNLYVINLSKYIIDFVCTSDIQTIFSILVMPATVISLFAQFIIHPVLLNVKSLIRCGDIKNLSLLIKKIVLLIVAFGIVSIVLLYFIGIPILNFIYGISLDSYRLCMVLVLIGSILYSIASVLSSVLVACRKVISQTVIYIILSVICTCISFLFIRHSHINGAIYSYLISMCLMFIAFYALTYYVLLIDFKKVK